MNTGTYQLWQLKFLQKKKPVRITLMNAQLPEKLTNQRANIAIN